MPFIPDETPWNGGRVSSRVVCVRANNPSAMTYVGTNTWIVAEPDASTCVVMDPVLEEGTVQRVVDACSAENLTIGAIFISHNHPDHTEGVQALAEATGAPVYAPEEKVAAAHAVQAGAFAFPKEAFRPFEGAPEFEIIPLPGHSADSVGLLLSAEKTLFTGDVVFRHGPTVVFHPDGVLGDYLNSLDKIESLVRAGTVEELLPGHGYPIEDPLQAVEATREHRLERLEQIKEALAAGTPPKADALFDVVYEGVDPRLKLASIRSIRAQLVYLGYLAE